MFIVTGAYHWWPKPVGFRNDFCLTCNAERRSVRIRTFDAGHIFWIPVLPVGFWKHWNCVVCGRDPHTSPRTRPFLKWVGFVILILFAILSWTEPVTPGDEAVSWAFRIGAPLGAILLMAHLLSTPKEPSLKERLAAIRPAADTVCPFCSSPMIGGLRWSCPACGAVRY
jgi:hypothetical protein